MLLPSHVTVGMWRPFVCPYCGITFEKEWANAHFQPRDGLGVACSPEDAADLNGVKKKADDALYASKQSGRNRVTSSAPAEKS